MFVVVSNCCQSNFIKRDLSKHGCLIVIEGISEFYPFLLQQKKHTYHPVQVGGKLTAAIVALIINLVKLPKGQKKYTFPTSCCSAIIYINWYCTIWILICWLHEKFGKEVPLSLIKNYQKSSNQKIKTLRKWEEREIRIQRK